MESSIVSELEGTLLKDHNPFSYFMLLAFEVSGLLRFVLLLILWPVIQFLGLLGMEDSGLKLMIFVAMAGIRESEINSVARAVLPKFYMDDLNVGAWKVFSSYDKRVVVTKTPRIMVEWFLKEHLQADEVIGIDLVVNRFGLATGFIKGGDNIDSFITTQIAKLFMDEKPFLGLGRSTSNASFLCICKEKMHPPVAIDNQKQHDDHQLVRPLPVIFHDGRLVKRPTPSTALLIILWLPLGILLATFRIVVGLMLPMWAKQYVSVVGGKLIVKGKPPSPACGGDKKGVLFVSNHRTLMDPVVISAVLGRRIPAATYSISRLSEILSPIPTFRLTRIRDVDAEKMKRALADGGLVVCPEGTTCREPFLLRFSALFAELTNRIVPVAMNCRVGFFHATTARGWKALDPIFLFMNPRPVYEVTFLNQLPLEATCSTGKSPHDVANYVQRILAATLGFECTNFTREDKYRILAGNDGTVTYTTFAEHIKKVIGPL